MIQLPLNFAQFHARSDDPVTSHLAAADEIDKHAGKLRPSAVKEAG